MIGSARLRSGIQAMVQVVYPPQCLTCNAIIGSDSGLCATCWRDTPFITGFCCDLCGVPLPGDAADHPVLCDDCLQIERPWVQGRAVMVYRNNARRLVLAFKHGDRTELARAAGQWMTTAGRSFMRDDQLVVPVPLHWRRLARRRYNQSALLARQIANLSDSLFCPDLLRRYRFTGTQDGKGRDARFDNVSGAIAVHPRRRTMLEGRPVLLVDDVMTSGATFAACADACLAAGAGEVRVLALARVAKDG